LLPPIPVLPLLLPPMPLDPELLLPLLLPPKLPLLPLPLRPLLSVPVPVLPAGGQSILDWAREPLPVLPLRPELLALPVLPLELLLLELELPLPVDPLPEAILPSGQSVLDRALLLPLRSDVLPDFPMEPEVPEFELPLPNPCELLPLEEPPLVCDQPGCKPNASVLDRANAVISVFRLLIRSCLLSSLWNSPTVALELSRDPQQLCHVVRMFAAAFLRCVCHQIRSSCVLLFQCLRFAKECVTMRHPKMVV
jgi:hypothetical protein